jgi:hypothetical protein
VNLFSRLSNPDLLQRTPIYAAGLHRNRLYAALLSTSPPTDAGLP